MTTKAAVLIMAPELVASDERWAQAISDAELEISAVDFGNAARQEKAARYLVAHLVSSKGGGGSGAAGPVQSETMGPVSRTYATTGYASSDHPYNSTGWGRAFLALVRSAGAGPIVL